MGLRILTNIPAQEVQKNLRINSLEQNDEFAKLSSGKRINKAADDAAGLAIGTSLDATARGLRQASRNANDGISLVQVAEGALQESTSILVRLRELSVQAASDTVGEAERGHLDKEYQQLLGEVERIAQSTTFNGAKVINGESGKGMMDFHVGAFAGEMNKISFDADATNASASSLGVSGTGVLEKQSANDSIANIDGAIEKISSFRATFGAIQSRLQSTVSNLDVQVLNQEAARSMIMDTDVAESSAKVASVNVMKQAAMSTLSQANQIPMSALRLIG